MTRKKHLIQHFIPDESCSVEH